MTKREMFNLIAKINADNKEIVDFCKHELELLDKKTSGTRKPTKNQKENEGYKVAILNYLKKTDKPMTVTMLWHDVPELANTENMSNQRITRILSQMLKDNLVENTKVKRVSYYVAK